MTRASRENSREINRENGAQLPYEYPRFLVIQVTRASRANSLALIARTAYACHMNNPISLSYR